LDQRKEGKELPENLASKCPFQVDSSKNNKVSSSPPAVFVVLRRLTVVSVWAEASISVVTCKCIRPDPIIGVAARAAAAARRAGLTVLRVRLVPPPARGPALLTQASQELPGTLDSWNFLTVCLPQ
jgi:hypothetical protein